jgi:hypothetical protein
MIKHFFLTEKIFFFNSEKKLMFSSINFIQTELQAIKQSKENYGYNYKLLQSLKHHLLLK